MIVRNNIDYTTIPSEMFDGFKEHLRILDNSEDSDILEKLSGAIDAISIYGDNDIFETQYTFDFMGFESFVSDRLFMGKTNISNVVITSNGMDVSTDYKVDEELGYIYPSPCQDDTVKFSSGYASMDDMPPRLKSVVNRYGSHLFEHREPIQIGEPKYLPDWVNFAIASIWKPRI